MLAQEENTIKAQNRIVNIQYIKLIDFGLIIYDLITKMIFMNDFNRV